MTEKSASQAAADAGGVVGPDVLAACALHALPGIGNSALHAIAAAFGTLRTAWEAGPEALLERAGDLKLQSAARDYLARKPDLHELGLWAVSAARSVGARVLLLGDAWYPPRLASIHNPPLVLYVRGHLAPEARRVAVVGARHADEQGLELARGLGDGLARAGVQVVSGGARGIDSAAHDGAFWGTGQSIAVLGCGIDVVYPPENRDLFDRMAKGAGAVVSEFPPGAAPLPKNFPRRNRTISALSEAVVIVRAALRSGAMITADHAAQQGRQLFAIPGDPGNPTAAGPNELLRLEVAKPVLGAADVLERLGWPVPDELRAPSAAPSQDDPGFPPRTDPGAGKSKGVPTDETIVDEEGLALWRLLDERTPVHVDDLAIRASLSVSQALRKLADLEQKGMCLQRPGKYFLRRKA
jgi:DNA processing protein